MEVKSKQDIVRLRRLALAAQGLSQVKPYGTGLAGARKAIEHLGYVQIDTIAVVERAHHHVIHSRVPQFKPEMTNQLLLNGDIFEYWAHAAAFLPMADFRFSLPYKQAIKSGQTQWYRERDQKLMGELLARIRSDGPLRSRDIETKAKKRAGWWDWKPAKKALEQLYMEGDLMVSSREGFQKTYDLTERVLPSHVNTQMPDMAEFAAHLLDRQLRGHGLMSMKGLTYLRRSTDLRKAVKDLVQEKLAMGELEQVKVSSGEVFVMDAGALERPVPRLNQRMLILSPFDNAVIQRDRLKSLFDYDYQIECYVPEAKRQFGYFCLPLLYRGAFVGRIDCKAHRSIRHLEVKALHLEQHKIDEAQLITAFVAAILPFSQFQACDSVSLTAAYPAHLTQRFQAALKPLG
ncbi:winged helix-turn-helix domain-containing protein [Photobacterium sp. 1_MG-2023]|uniref:winged helix-turn-helix domain-containing protein n=1 Tax=Photobacterium sp. 1_MG-2023 TaxID=3062646 RepID=UPI0026E47986|nr:crosslink repair DNA glycosylase YcaQ family protein [Photobacterium sp. 1_MG-2023]MDO6705128.1 crosslink repair DNA glycosylase YcaQ family protein [Photobacterium sp. 1_MG-2023]